MPDDPIFDAPAGMPRLLAIMRRLRDPDTGCPWDIEQTFATIAPHTIEEAYEVADAIEREDWSELKGELGDLLLQTVFHSVIAEDAELFDFQDVAKGISQKLIDRHPHIFGDESRDKSAEQQTQDWEAIKAKERSVKQQTGALEGVAVGLPALLRAVKLQNRAARVGFDWPETGQVLDKLIEESKELIEARDQMSDNDVFEEFGDMLFVMANLARHFKIDPEAALRAANNKFVDRFEKVEEKLRAIGKTPQQSSLEEMDALWDLVKSEARSNV